MGPRGGRADIRAGYSKRADNALTCVQQPPELGESGVVWRRGRPDNVVRLGERDVGLRPEDLQQGLDVVRARTDPAQASAANGDVLFRVDCQFEYPGRG